MATLPFDDAGEHEPPAASPGTRPGLWGSLLARLRAAPVAAPFHDSDFEPTDWPAPPQPDPGRR